MSLPLHAQLLHADAPLPTFDVATIRPTRSAELWTNRSPRELQMFAVTVRYLMEQAWNIPWTNGSKDRIRGGPSWIDSDHFDLDAKVAPETATALEQMPEQQRRTQMNLRLQSLLADRLKLKLHFETRQEPVFAITVAKNGPELRPTAPNPEGAQHAQGISVRYTGQAAQMTAKAVTLGDLANWLTGYSEMAGQTVSDQTGLVQRYDFILSWTRTSSSAEQDTTASGPALFTALEEQLGLKLASTKGPVEIIVIDSIARPTAN
jgi:uncharacterized protein (TIGR03435 family)